jgi:hypothetical protein
MLDASGRPVGARWLGWLLIGIALLGALLVAASAYARGLEPLSHADKVCIAPNGVDSPERQACLEREMNENVEPWAVPLVGGLLVLGIAFLLFARSPKSDQDRLRPGL